MCSVAADQIIRRRADQMVSSSLRSVVRRYFEPRRCSRGSSQAITAMTTKHTPSVARKPLCQAHITTTTPAASMAGIPASNSSRPHSAANKAKISICRIYSRLTCLQGHPGWFIRGRDVSTLPPEKSVRVRTAESTCSPPNNRIVISAGVGMSKS